MDGWVKVGWVCPPLGLASLPLLGSLEVGAEAKKRRRESTDSEGMVTSLLLWSLLILRLRPGIAGLLWGVEI